MSLSGSQRAGWLDEARQRVRDYNDMYRAQAAELEPGDVPLIPAWTPATPVPSYSRATATRVDAAPRLHHAVLGGTRHAYELAILQRLGGSWPCFFESARINRRHTVFAAEYLAQAGFDQFLDLGSGLPYHFAMRDGRRSYGKVEHVHEAVARIQPEAPVVYVDIAPIAVAFLRSSMDDDDNCAYVHGDVRHIETLLASDQVAGHLDLTRPVAVLAHDVLSWMTLTEARDTARELRDALPPGSALSITHPTDDLGQPMSMLTPLCEEAGIVYRPRPRAEIEALFGGWPLLPPGLVPTGTWSPRHEGAEAPGHRSGAFAGIAVKPDRPTAAA
ncbi:SAM-dependent methyltransferase [Streptomyces microflavus]|uniref:SAM-dependent methyltransferase n=1 Tax=Streptomyces microflavus TaxID=1919 RepID=UPI00382A93A5